METKFIKYRADQVNLVNLYRISSGCTFDSNDVKDGTLVIGYYGDGRFPAIGYIRGITRDDDTGEVIYEIENAIAGQDYTTSVKTPYRVNTCELPCFVATAPDFPRPVVGRIYKCNGELAVMDTSCGNVTVNVNSVHQLTPYFKENK